MTTRQKIIGIVALAVVVLTAAGYLLGNWSASEICYASKLDKGYTLFRTRGEVNDDCQRNHLFFPFYYFDRH
jgi:hypothetical protein